MGRELTKSHEEFLRGTINAVLAAIGEPRGEFTALLDIGQMLRDAGTAPPSPASIAADFGDMTKLPGMTRRRVVAALAKKHHLTANAVYAAIESAKKSAE